eukprot:g2842.t1
MTSSTVCLFKLSSKKRYYILIAPRNKNDVYLVGIDPYSGALQYSATSGRHLFPNREAAETHLRRLGSPEVVGSGVAVLGYIVIGRTGLLLIAEKTKVTATLPGPVTINTISVSKWFQISLQPHLTELQRRAISKNTRIIESQIRKIVTFPLKGDHWFSEDADVTRPFPSMHPKTQPCYQFVWNAWLAQSFRSINLIDCCPAVMEGTAETRRHKDSLGNSFQLVLLSRRSRLNPGTRYIARGLNEASEPGNEIECEQIVWREIEDSKEQVFWTRYSWRRGTVPIKWTTRLKSKGFGKPEIRVRDDQPFNGCKNYIRRVQKRFCPKQEPENRLKQGPREVQDSTSAFPVVFVSLLRKGVSSKHKSENNLASAFSKALSIMRKSHGLNTVYYSLDWHEMDKQLGTSELIIALWTAMKGILKEHGVASGHYMKNGVPGRSQLDSNRSDWMGRETIDWISQQQGLVRYNCADSLDRTNIASFFVSVQVFLEQCCLLKLDVLVKDAIDSLTPRDKVLSKEALDGSAGKGVLAAMPNKDSTGETTNNIMNSDSIVSPRQESGVAPNGAGIRHIDSEDRISTIVLPTEGIDRTAEPSSSVESGTEFFQTRSMDAIQLREEWAMMNLTVDEIKRKVLPEMLASIAEVFLLNGDRSSFFYTGSVAMFSNKLTIFEPEMSPLKKNGFNSSNRVIAVKRRINNVLRDSERQVQIELFLGINLEKHFSASNPASFMDLDALNVIYKPSRLELEFTELEDDNSEQISCPTLAYTSEQVLRDKGLLMVDPQRTSSSPVFQTQHSSFSESSKEYAEL